MDLVMLFPLVGSAVSLLLDQEKNARKPAEICANQIVGLELDVEMTLDECCEHHDIERIENLAFHEVEIGMKFSLVAGLAANEVLQDLQLCCHTDLPLLEHFNPKNEPTPVRL